VTGDVAVIRAGNRSGRGLDKGAPRGSRSAFNWQLELVMRVSRSGGADKTNHRLAAARFGRLVGSNRNQIGEMQS